MNAKTMTLPMPVPTQEQPASKLPQYAADKLREATRRAEESVARMKKKLTDSRPPTLTVVDQEKKP